MPCTIHKYGACLLVLVIYTAAICMSFWNKTFLWHLVQPLQHRFLTKRIYWNHFTGTKYGNATDLTTSAETTSMEGVNSSSTKLFQGILTTLTNTTGKNMCDGSKTPARVSKSFRSMTIAKSNVGKTWTTRSIESRNRTSQAKVRHATQTTTRVSPSVKDKNKTFLCVQFSGRLGNLMFEFASLLGTARLHGVTPVLPRNSHLRNVFSIDIPEIDDRIVSTFKHIGERRACAYDPLVGNFAVNNTMYGYFQSWRYFSNVAAELRRHFTFKDNFINLAIANLKQSIRKQHGAVLLQNTTFVGVHIRRGDMVQPHAVQYGYAVGRAEYIAQAMHFFLTKYHRVMFVVCSNDMAWAKTAVPQENATFITDQAAEVDMATLSLCNHTILTVGSYGWWAGWLAGGITTYQIQQVIPGTPLSTIFNLTDYMLPGWIGFNQTNKV